VPFSLTSDSVLKGNFHDFRRAALSNLLTHGMSEHDVMVLAGLSDFATTHKFYLAVADYLIERVRAVAIQTIGKNLLQIFCDRYVGGSSEKSQQM
jgi:integrase